MTITAKPCTKADSTARNATITSTIILQLEDACQLIPIARNITSSIGALNVSMGTELARLEIASMIRTLKETSQVVEPSQVVVAAQLADNRAQLQL